MKRNSLGTHGRVYSIHYRVIFVSFCQNFRIDPPRPSCLVVVCLGRVVPELSGRASSSSSYVLPVGFVSRRQYSSVLRPERRVWYESRVEAVPGGRGRALSRARRDRTGQDAVGVFDAMPVCDAR